MNTYTLGNKYNNTFDYKGLINYALSITVNTDLNTLTLLHRSFEDVNYHKEGKLLSQIIKNNTKENILILHKQLNSKPIAIL